MEWNDDITTVWIIFGLFLTVAVITQFLATCVWNHKTVNQCLQNTSYLATIAVLGVTIFGYFTTFKPLQEERLIKERIAKFEAQEKQYKREGKARLYDVIISRIGDNQGHEKHYYDSTVRSNKTYNDQINNAIKSQNSIELKKFVFNKYDYIKHYLDLEFEVFDVVSYSPHLLSRPDDLKYFDFVINMLRSHIEKNKSKLIKPAISEKKINEIFEKYRENDRNLDHLRSSIDNINHFFGWEVGKYLKSHKYEILDLK